MGSWGTAPWDSDSAADWFGDVLEQPAMAIHRELKVVANGKRDFNEQTYAAVWLLSHIGLRYVYSVDLLDDDVALALDLLSDHTDAFANSYGDADSSDEIRRELGEIAQRLMAPQPPGLGAKLGLAT